MSQPNGPNTDPAAEEDRNDHPLDFATRLIVIVHATQQAIDPHFNLDENAEHIENFFGVNNENKTASDSKVMGLLEEENRQLVVEFLFVLSFTFCIWLNLPLETPIASETNTLLRKGGFVTSTVYLSSCLAV